MTEEVLEEKKTRKQRTSRPKMPEGRVFIGQLFELLEKCSTKDQKKKLLQEYAARSEEQKKTLQFIVECVYHPKVIFELPPGAPPYTTDANKSSSYETYQTNLFRVMTTIFSFCKCPKLIQNSLQREKTFQQILEGLHPTEAKLLCMIKDKNLDSYKGVNEKLFRDVFPEWLPK